jgi:hypothetical protein
MALAACFAASSASLAACVQDGGYSESIGGDGFYGGGSTSTDGYDDGGITGDGAPSSTPMLAKIDPNGTMKQTPGQGIGVFTQYAPGGHWYVWWTCDTNLSDDTCPYTIDLSVAHGDITNATSEGFAPTDDLSGGGTDGGGTDGGGTDADGGTPQIPGSPSITAQTLTTTTVQGVRFDTEPGAIVTLSAALNGEYSGSFLFFVQDDRVNGGYTGPLTDPLEFQSTSP